MPRFGDGTARLLAIASPIVTGILFGVLAVAGLLTGASVGGAAGHFPVNTAVLGTTPSTSRRAALRSRTLKAAVWCRVRARNHKAAVIGDTVGDPLKDTSAPP